MNKLIVSSVALVASLAGSAMAADMPIRPPVVVESWTGFYVGVALGGRFSDSKWTTNCLSTGAPGGVGCPLNLAANGTRFLTDNPSGLSSATFRSSVYLGYNWQVGNWVVGAEGDAAYGQGNNSIKGIPGAENLVQLGSPGNDTVTIKDSWDASARARAGFLHPGHVAVRDRRCVLDPSGGERILRQRQSDRLVPGPGRAGLQCRHDQHRDDHQDRLD